MVLAVVLAAAGLAGAGFAAVPLARAMLPGKARDAAGVHARQTERPAGKTVVSLTFDDAYEDQWLYAVPLLRSEHMNATFYVITADSDGPYPCCMSWAQLRTLQGEGDDIGSHTIDHPNLTTLAASRISQEVCRSRQDMLRNGIDDPESFAYPYGSYNSADESIVARCGFTNARQGGGISSSNTVPGPPWVESLPARHPEAVRTIAVDGANPIRLTDLENYVTGAAFHGGGWLVITFHDVCNPYASDYVNCMSSYGPVSDIVLGQFLRWLHGTGHPGDAPAGVVVRTMRWATNTTKRPDTTPPSTTARCDGSPCQTAVFGHPVRVSLSAADRGGVGVAKTYYTTDRSAPSTSSKVYQTPLILDHSGTIRFFSVDNAGNREKVKIVTVKIG